MGRDALRQTGKPRAASSSRSLPSCAPRLRTRTGTWAARARASSTPPPLVNTSTTARSYSSSRAARSAWDRVLTTRTWSPWWRSTAAKVRPQSASGSTSSTRRGRGTACERARGVPAPTCGNTCHADLLATLFRTSVRNTDVAGPSAPGGQGTGTVPGRRHTRARTRRRGPTPRVRGGGGSSPERAAAICETIPTRAGGPDGGVHEQVQAAEAGTSGFGSLTGLAVAPGRSFRGLKMTC